ncbi:hypothetical protein D3C79_960760 [compost metagenome]
MLVNQCKRPLNCRHRTVRHSKLGAMLRDVTQEVYQCRGMPWISLGNGSRDTQCLLHCVLRQHRLTNVTKRFRVPCQRGRLRNIALTSNLVIFITEVFDQYFPNLLAQSE